jgi:hypothetical protein
LSSLSYGLTNMLTRDLVNYSKGDIDSFYASGVISQAQYESYCWLWANSTFRYSDPIETGIKFESLDSDVQAEILVMADVLHYLDSDGKINFNLKK